MSMVPVAEARGVSMVFEGTHALRDVSVSVRPGRITAICGANGSGKSTLLKCLAGLETPTSGVVTLADRPLADLSRRDIARQLAVLGQNPETPAGLNVEELVEQDRYPHRPWLGRLTAHDREAIEAAIRRVDLGAMRGRQIATLSGGERQRAWISAALAQEAGILLLDEPTSFLDIGYQVEVLDLVHRLSRERGVTILMAIHDINQAIAVSDRISLLEKGVLRFDGAPRALAESGLIERTFRVKGRFVEVAPDKPPHFDVELTTLHRLGS